MVDAGKPEASGPMAADALGDVEEAAWGEAARSGRLELVELISVSCADQLGLQPLTLPPRLRLRTGGAAGRRRADHVEPTG